ncbi:phosphonate C-P lyase system protein PhnG [Microvirga massiliensis]|uniref:phosphonate C-P lyase system protein PhnG n=1 Tax=Microvirga massiliensis TaxID=1033741 RepID=UPI000A5F0406|nr:phosphonate C-P lyase system protein PhnG [Microvirga massiliensis]
MLDTEFPPEIAKRRWAMALCAEAVRTELESALDGLGDIGKIEDLRPVETGLVMVRGRIGGDGAPFNLGEATVTRAAVRVDERLTGFSYQLGRDGRKAHLSATLDALIQAPERRDAVTAALAPIEARIATEREVRARRIAATRVNFFTMVRGED